MCEGASRSLEFDLGGEIAPTRLTHGHHGGELRALLTHRHPRVRRFSGGVRNRPGHLVPGDVQETVLFFGHVFFAGATL